MTRTMQMYLMVALTIGLVTPWAIAADGELVEIRVSPAYAPRGPIAPSWNGYVTRAINALEVDAASVGDLNTNPGAYKTVTSNITPLDMIYTDFNSWNSTAAPSDTFTSRSAAFQAEFGNRIHFGLHLVGNSGQTFALDNLSWELDSDDATDYFDQAGDFKGQNYSPNRVGIQYGPNGVKGGGDDIVLDNGQAGTTLVDELIYVGVGDGFFSSEPDATSDNDDIDRTLRKLLQDCAPCTFDLTGMYSLDVGAAEPIIGFASVTVDIEPGYGGDFDRDGTLDCDDLDMLTTEISQGTNDILFDLNLDGKVDFQDLHNRVKDIQNTWFGDADCDGEFNSSDLIQVFLAGKYESGMQDDAVWTEGDWNGDGEFTSSDMIVAFLDGGYELGPVPAVAAVPEPSTIVLTLLGFVCLVARRRR